ncbi:O-methyltransferase [Basidiobolus meristosporus CBS 931.73]|uniref:O-methyltransferase n=1 Tax=Basidiobolus meristosporus CBS 931.73 TaxID=1314790 RepID=A0A1Y1X5R7_9FUNG|nr:O-methyltransferase [Basidiobolus meristosporus CBS 931.73]|eukprot:ORX80995.1 O-methyltransferase [Basidiobolus meristosporus CBS 931.73]
MLSSRLILQKVNTTFVRNLRCYSVVPSSLEGSSWYVQNKSSFPKELDAVFNLTQERFPDAFKMISPHQGQLLKQIVRFTKSRNILEIGTFTGYSALCMLAGLPTTGKCKLVTCEADETAARVAREAFQTFDKRNRIELMVGPAQQTLEAFPPGTQFDLVFLDANKGGYVQYYETILNQDLLADNGLIVADNVLFRGEVPLVATDPIGTQKMKAAQAMHRFNEHVFQDPRTEQVILPLFDGLNLIQKVQQ